MHVLSRPFLMIAALCFLIACPGPVSTTECAKDSECTESGQKCCIAEGKTKGECKAEADCKKAKTCEKDQEPCSKQDDCLNKKLCKDGCCVEEAQGPVCSKDGDCDKGKECAPSGTEKRCRSCSKSCQSTTDCTGQDSCNNGCCGLPPCTNDNDCKDRSDATHCNTKTQKCVACTENKQCQSKTEKSICRDDVCENVECTNDAHCSSPKSECNLQTFKCAEPSICKTDADCVDSSGQLIRCDPNANGGRGACKKGHCVKCSGDDECGGPNDFCVGKDKGLKDGTKCLIKCESNNDCNKGFLCSDAIFSKIKLCFPVNGFCEDPCLTKQCPDKHRCLEGECIKIPEPCDPCTKDEDCGPQNKCQTYGAKKFCSRACTGSGLGDCPAPAGGRDYLCLGGQCIDQNQCQ